MCGIQALPTINPTFLSVCDVADVDSIRKILFDLF